MILHAGTSTTEKTEIHSNKNDPSPALPPQQQLSHCLAQSPRTQHPSLFEHLQKRTGLVGYCSAPECRNHRSDMSRLLRY